jgi:hypothetical protein
MAEPRKYKDGRGVDLIPPRGAAKAKSVVLGSDQRNDVVHEANNAPSRVL